MGGFALLFTFALKFGNLHLKHKTPLMILEGKSLIEHQTLIV